jgi:hypothetical protein
MNRIGIAPVITAGLLLLPSSVSVIRADIEPIEAIVAETETPEHRLLDVGILVLDPGLPEGTDKELEEKGIFRDVRKSEARYIPFQLKSTLEATGHWGAVRVVPIGSEGIDVFLAGRIVASNGHKLNLRMRIVDSTGRVWRDKEYEREVEPESYDPDRVENRDPYQSVYNRIANDMLDSRDDLIDEKILQIRQVSGLRFAVDLAPDVYGDYLRVKRNGRYRVRKLPDPADPMMARISRLRVHDAMFVDTLNEFYAEFYADMNQVYYDWRYNSWEEVQAFLEIRRKARRRKIIGGLLIFAGVVAQGGSVDNLGDVALIGGAAAVQSGIEKAKEAKIHREVLKELGASFDAEVAPILVEVEGRTVRLEGSAENQFAEWRRLLRDIFATETGLPVDPNTGRILPETSPGD